MRAEVRGGITGSALLLTALLAGCGTPQAPSGPERPAASKPPSGSPSTAPGVDGEADPDRAFAEADLKAALLPAAAFGERAKVTDTHVGLFGESGGGDWTQCVPADALVEEKNGFEGASAQQVVHLTPGVEDGPVVTVQLVSMPTGDTERYLEIRRLLHESCPEVTVDTEAAPVQEHHHARDIARLGDEALLEVSRLTGGDEYDGTRSYTVDVRVGGVLAIVESGADKDTGVSVAAQAARRIRAELYGTDGTRASRPHDGTRSPARAHGSLA